MLGNISLLVLVIALSVCLTRAQAAEPGDAPKPQGHGLLNGLFREDGPGQSFEPGTRKALSAKDAAALAAKLANEQCQKQYHRSPFKPDQYSLTFRDGVYHWGKLDVGGVGGFSAIVKFERDGSKPRTEVYFSSDSLVVK